MSCESVRAAHLAGARTAADDAHLRGCRACRAALTDLDEVRRRLADPGLWEEPAADLGDRVVRAIREEGSPRGRAPAVGRPRWLPLAGAAAALVLVAAAAVGLRAGGDDPDWQVALVATSAAPGASGTATGWNGPAGTRIELEVEGLAPSGPDAYYALWLTSEDGRHLPAGTFTSDGTVVLWAGGTRADFPRLWVTLEPDDEDESLSGTSVLDTPA